ncbi:MAG: nucleoside-diphosphate kinase [Spirochaetes bacterium]|nr:nucleoside-diphosphate kinase [Spirochaetota bacterium]
MSKTLSYVLVTPYTIAKSRTGGVLSRLLLRTDLELVGAQIFAPDDSFVSEYSQRLRKLAPPDQPSLLADYIERNLAPADDRPHRTLFLLFQGENAAEKLMAACGHIFPRDLELDVNDVSGETIRDTYADLIPSKDDPNEITYFEPAVLTPRNQKEADEDMAIFARFFDGRENMTIDAGLADAAKKERTLVIIKPDNWVYNSSRPGAIMDMFSRTGLRVMGMKVHCFSLAQALDFYGPVEGVLKEKLSPMYGKKAQALLEKEFGFGLSEKTRQLLIENFGPECAQNEFFSIVEFMTGKRPYNYPQEELDKPGEVKCMILVYEGENAVSKIRDVLGPTDPLKAPEGTVRREFGSNIMVNTAHASDSVESFEREKVIVRLNENTVCSILKDYLGIS